MNAKASKTFRVLIDIITSLKKVGRFEEAKVYEDRAAKMIADSNFITNPDAMLDCFLFYKARGEIEKAKSHMSNLLVDYKNLTPSRLEEAALAANNIEGWKNGGSYIIYHEAISHCEKTDKAAAARMAVRAGSEMIKHDSYDTAIDFYQYGSRLSEPGLFRSGQCLKMIGWLMYHEKNPKRDAEGAMYWLLQAIGGIDGNKSEEATDLRISLYKITGDCALEQKLFDVAESMFKSLSEMTNISDDKQLLGLEGLSRLYEAMANHKDKTVVS